MSVATEVLETLKQRGVIVRQVKSDSRRVESGDVFLAFPGEAADGRDYIDQALAHGAAAVVAESAGVRAPIVVNEQPLILAVHGLVPLSGQIAHRVYGRPSEKLWLAGVTGTNGKTSVTQWIAQALTLLRQPCGVMGTLGNGVYPHLEPSPNTTPDAITLHASLSRYVELGVAACAMEVSSIGMDQSRVSGAVFDVAVLTNLTRDHLDYHGTMEAYAEAKEAFFRLPRLTTAVLNLDDAFGQRIAAMLNGRVRVIGYTLAGVLNRDNVDEVLNAERLEMTSTGVRFVIRGVVFTAAVVGRFNVANLLAVTGALLAKGETLADIALAIAQLAPPPGRMDIVKVEPSSNQPLVVVDYAHTPDALEKALTVLRETATARGGRLICVFGCGGERDSGKRPLMGGIAQSLADRVLVTADNPRGEDEQKIFNDILSGMRSPVEVIADRAQAIAAAIAEASATDVILLAGKGHETYQEIAGVRHPFLDSDIARRALEQRSS